jgi:hypothetical protein
MDTGRMRKIRRRTKNGFLGPRLLRKSNGMDLCYFLNEIKSILI